MNSFGRLFRVSIYGESHGKEIGVLIDGCPAGLPLEESDFMIDLSRRKSGGKGTTPRLESDTPAIKSGVFNGKTTGAPVLIAFENSGYPYYFFSDDFSEREKDSWVSFSITGENLFEILN